MAWGMMIAASAVGVAIGLRFRMSALIGATILVIIIGLWRWVVGW